MNTKKVLLTTLALLTAFGITPLKAQTACSGWNSPASFTIMQSNNNEQYSGRTGTKPYRAGNCSTGTLPVDLDTTTIIPASQLATTTDNGGSNYCGSTLNPSNQFRIMHSTDYANGKDPLASGSPGLPLLPPSSFGNFSSSIRLGNCQIDNKAEALYYDFDVSPENSLLKLNYAIVVQAPGHTVTGDPAFWIRVLIENDNGTFVPIDDAYCYVISSTPGTGPGQVQIGQDGWHQTSGSGGTIYYRDWNQVAISLSNYWYRRVRIEMAMGDCAASGHYGYAYIAGSCQPMNLTAGGCASGESDTITYLTAPLGMDSYHWYRSNIGIIDDPSDVDPTHTWWLPITVPTNQSTLPIRSQYFRPAGVPSSSDSLLMQTTFLCELESHMTPGNSFYSYIRTNVDNLKPKPRIDTIYSCDNTVKIRDISTAYSPNGGRGVAYNLTEWDFYDQPRYNNNPLLSPAGHYVGDSAVHQFSYKGNHCVRVRCFNIDSTTCYADKEFAIRSLTAPIPTINFSNNNPCADSLVTIYNNTKDTFGIGANQVILDAVYHHWHIYDEQGFDTVFETSSNHFDIRLKDTCWVELTTHVDRSFLGDTNNDGRQDVLYCDGVGRRKIFVESPPTLKVIGDTIVCNGRTSTVSVQASLPNCTYTWYDGGRPSQGGVALQTTNTLVTQPTSDKVYFVEVVSENGCRSWDSIEISLLKPSIDYWTKYGKPEVCEGDTVKLWSSRAMKYDWYGTPADPSLQGQEHNDTVWAVPSISTEYAVIGYGGTGDNECQADPMKQKIVVHPYPQLQIRLTPDYIDSDNPSVQFSDISEYGTSSLWDFGNGATATTRSVVHTFTDLSQDSLLIKLRSFNPLQCYRDTAFYIPVGIFTVWYPNAFTPRLETNKYFRATTANELHDYELRIYDRAGGLIFFSVDPAEPWDGTYQGEECKEGVYVYIATYRRPGVERKLQQRGTVLLIK